MIGAALVGVVVPSLRPFLDAGPCTVYTAFKSSWGVDVQAFGRILPSARHPSKSNYKFINGNHSKAHYDYTVKSHVQLAKLYLRQVFMANFTAINDECDPSAVLNLLETLPHLPGSGFTTAIQDAAREVREQVRNPWAHCNWAEWDTCKFQTCFQLMDKLLAECGLANAAADLKEWEQKGSTYKIVY